LHKKNKLLQLTAIEIDKGAALQAKENFESSSWKNRLTVLHTSIQQYASEYKGKFEVIISNPPFFKKNLASINAKRNLAMHSTALHFEELVHSANALLQSSGLFCVMIPHDKHETMIELCREKKFISSTANQFAPNNKACLLQKHFIFYKK